MRDLPPNAPLSGLLIPKTNTLHTEYVQKWKLLNPSFSPTTAFTGSSRTQYQVDRRDPLTTISTFHIRQLLAVFFNSVFHLSLKNIHLYFNLDSGIIIVFPSLIAQGNIFSLAHASPKKMFSFSFYTKAVVKRILRFSRCLFPFGFILCFYLFILLQCPNAKSFVIDIFSNF